MTPTADEMHDYFFNQKRVFIRVYQLPEKLTNGYCFGGGNPITLLNVDWCEYHETGSRVDLEEFLQGKMYIKPGVKFLVISNKPEFTFQFVGKAR